jgi:DNA repair protein RadD
MSAPDLRPYQNEIIAEFDQVRASGTNRIMLMAPTGSGKTIIAAEIIRNELRAFGTVLILSHRREITKQTSAKFFAAGINHAEAHHCPARTYQKIINEYPDATLLGLTAPPCRGDGRGLGTIFQVIIECPQVAELIKQKYLVPTRVYAPVDPDLRGIRTVQGDYHEAELADRMDRAQLVGDIVSHWHKYSEQRKTA